MNERLTTIPFKEEMQQRLTQYHKDHPIGAVLNALQSQILDRLEEPPLREELTTWIQRETLKYRGPDKKGSPVPITTLHAYNRGCVFEHLVKADNQIIQGPESPLAVEIREFMKAPEKYGCPHIRTTCPDFLWTDRKHRIRGLVECKSGRVVPSQLTQLHNLQSDTRSIIQILVSLGTHHLRRVGLKEISGSLDSLRVISNFRSVLVLPRNTDLTNGVANEMATSLFEIFFSPFSHEEIITLVKVCEERFLDSMPTPVYLF